MFLLCFLINCIKLIKETAVSACVFGYHRKKQVRNLCLRDAVLTGGLLVIGTFIETEFLHENAIVLIPIINGVAFYIWKRQSIRESIKAYVLSYMIVEVVDSILYVCIALLANVSVNDLGFSDPIMDGICSLPGLFLWALIYKLQKKKSDVWTLVNRNFGVLFAGGILAAVQVSFLTYIVGGWGDQKRGRRDLCCTYDVIWLSCYCMCVFDLHRKAEKKERPTGRANTNI